MDTRIIPAAAAALAVLALSACSVESKTTGSKPQNAASGPGKLTAEKAVEALADAIGVTTLGNPQDNTGFCSNEAAGKEPHENDCTKLITTDMVSLYEFDSPALAKQWTKGMEKVGDWRPVDRFTPAWTSRDQGSVPEGRRAELVAALKRLVNSKS